MHGLRAPAVENPAPGDVAAGEQFFFGKGNCGSVPHGARPGRLDRAGPFRSGRAPQPYRRSRLRSKIPSRRITPGYRVATVRLRDGSTLRGLLKNESTFDLQLQGLDGQLHLLDGDEIGCSRSREDIR